MEIKILSPLWGHEHRDLTSFVDQIKEAGYDGIDTWVPSEAAQRKLLYDHLQQEEMCIVTHQHAAAGADFHAFKLSFREQLELCAEPGPILINSHTGRDYFSFNQNTELIEIASDFSARTGILVCHETHRGRFGYSPQMIQEFFNMQTPFSLTADLSHWVCVTESMLEHFGATLKETIRRSRCIHARVGFEEGPQVPHPGAPEWQYALDHFLGWWDAIVAASAQAGVTYLPITTEAGPQPYMPSHPYTNSPVADQYEVNTWMKDLLHNRYALYR